MADEPHIVQATVAFTGQGGLGEEPLTFNGEALKEQDDKAKARAAEKTAEELAIREHEQSQQG